MATYQRYSVEDLQKAINSVESGRDFNWASMRYGVPVATLRRKHKQFKQEKSDD